VALSPKMATLTPKTAHRIVNKARGTIARQHVKNDKVNEDRDTVSVVSGQWLIPTPGGTKFGPAVTAAS